MLETTADPTDEAHAAVRFSSDEWGVLKTSERGTALSSTREAPGTGARLARKLRRRARHRLNRGMRSVQDVGSVVLAWPDESGRGDVWVGE